MTEEDIKKLSKKELQDIVLKMQKILSDKQKEEFQKIVKVAGIQSENKTSQVVQVRMSDALVAEKMVQIQKWKNQTGLRNITTIRELVIIFSRIFCQDRARKLISVIGTLCFAVYLI